MNDTPAPQAFHCPSCGAGLSAADAPSVTCEYCGASVLVPPEYRPARPPVEPPPSVTVIQVQPSLYTPPEVEPKSSSCSTWVILIAILLLVGVGIAGVAYYQQSMTNRLVNQIEEAIEITIPTIEISIPLEDFPEIELLLTPQPTPVPEADILLTFGSLGESPGQFKDPRSIAVDRQGQIYVADYSSGRVQQFDPPGHFIQLIQVPSTSGDDDIYIDAIGIASNPQGQERLFVVSEGAVRQYDPQTGELIAATPDRWPTIYHENLAVTADYIFTNNGMAGTDDIVKMDWQGKLLAHWQEVIQTVEDDDPAINLEMATDSAGNIYVLSSMAYTVYVYDPEGQFLYTFGQTGDQPGQFSGFADVMAIDASDRLYIASSYRIDVFNTRGEYLGRSFSIDYDTGGGPPMDITIERDGLIYLVTNGGKVLQSLPPMP